MATKKIKEDKLKKDKKNLSSEPKKVVKELSEKLLKLMGSKAKVEVKEDKKNDAIIVEIKTEDEAGLLIGNRGETLSSIQMLLGMMYRKRTEKWQRILVDVADWREKQEERLKALAEQTAERVISTGNEQTLYNLNASQRRIVHLSLSKKKEVETESSGEGRERYLIVRPKKGRN